MLIESTLQWPNFKAVCVLTKKTLKKNCYSYICSMNSKNKYAYLLPNEGLLAKFIDYLAKSDCDYGKLRLYDLYVASNIVFPPKTVYWAEKGKKTKVNIKDLAQLLHIIISYPHAKKCSVVLSETLGDNLFVLRRKILQQFIYLRIFFPVTTSKEWENNSKDTALRPNDNVSYVAVLGTKKSGKSTLIDALLGEMYAPFSIEIPTPNCVMYIPGSVNKKFSLCLSYDYKKYYFSDAKSLREYLRGVFREANENDRVLESMKVYIKNYPLDLKPFVIVDTPGSNFAGAVSHAKVSENALDNVQYCLFVVNYSSHLTNDEVDLLEDVYTKLDIANCHESLLVVVNRIDDMYNSEYVTSPVWVADYIRNRLSSLEYENVLVITTSALLSVYMKNVASSLQERNVELFDKLSSLRKKNKGTDLATGVAFVEKVVDNLETTSFDELESFSGIEIVKKLMRHTLRLTK